MQQKDPNHCGTKLKTVVNMFPAVKISISCYLYCKQSAVSTDQTTAAEQLLSFADICTLSLQNA